MQCQDAWSIDRNRATEIPILIDRGDKESSDKEREKKIKRLSSIKSYRRGGPEKKYIKTSP